MGLRYSERRLNPSHESVACSNLAASRLRLGLIGDAVQMSSVLRHLRKYRPHWVIDFQAESGRHKVGRGIARNIFCYGEPYPSAHYDSEHQIVLYDTFPNWHDRPNTRVATCLHERFGIDWDRECGDYLVNISPQAIRDAETIVHGRKMVAIHYQGDSDKINKDLSHKQAGVICDHVVKLGRIPLLLDWRDSMPLGSRLDVKTVGQYKEWGSDAEMNCAVISLCEAFVGIDSGPSKCASATKTPALVTWTGHHPSPFHDPAPNTTHLVPVDYHGLKPVCDDPGVIKWFEENHAVRRYADDPVVEIKAWLSEILR